MIFLQKARLVLLSQPKTGTTALDAALSSRASIVVSKPPELKHISYRGFVKFVAPLIREQAGLERSDYEVVAVMREPVDWVGSWYRYRTRDKLQKPKHPRAVNSTAGLSFDDFVSDVVRPEGERPPYASIRTPSWVALDGSRTVGVDRLFPYEAFASFLDYLEERTGRSIETRTANVSPKMELSLLPDRLEQLRQHFAFDVALHASLSEDGSVPPAYRATDGDVSADEDLSPGV